MKTVLWAEERVCCEGKDSVVFRAKVRSDLARMQRPPHTCFVWEEDELYERLARLLIVAAREGRTVSFPGLQYAVNRYDNEIFKIQVTITDREEYGDVFPGREVLAQLRKDPR